MARPGLVLLYIRQDFRTQRLHRGSLPFRPGPVALGHSLRDGTLQPLPGWLPVQEQVPAVSSETQTQHRQNQPPSLQGNGHHPSLGLLCSLWCVSMAMACTICPWHRYDRALPAFSYAAVSYSFLFLSFSLCLSMLTQVIPLGQMQRTCCLFCGALQKTKQPLHDHSSTHSYLKESDTAQREIFGWQITSQRVPRPFNSFLHTPVPLLHAHNDVFYVSSLAAVLPSLSDMQEVAKVTKNPEK